MSAELDPPFGPRDPANMAGRIEAAPEQIEGALATSGERRWRVPVRSPDLLAVGALGGSAIAADLCAALYSDRLPRPIIIVRDYRLPACVTSGSLLLVSSYSGETEESLALYREAGRRGIPRVAISSGGELARSCERDGVPFVSLPGGSPPRAALLSSWVALTRLLEALEWIEDQTPDWREAAGLLRARNARWGPAAPERRNPAKQAARTLEGRFVFVYCGSERLGPVATRVRNQLNENAKLLGHSALVPELNHNEIVGWESLGPPGETAGVLLLKDPEDSPEVAARLTLTADYVRRRGVPIVEESEAQGGRLARMASMVHFGDYLSLYLALLKPVDPTPIASVDEFKRRLMEWREQRAQ